MGSVKIEQFDSSNSIVKLCGNQNATMKN